jgi:hypothetical protein
MVRTSVRHPNGSAKSPRGRSDHETDRTPDHRQAGKRPGRPHASAAYVTSPVTRPGAEDALVSCLVSPGFDFDDFELADGV